MRILASSAFIGVHRRPFDCFSRSRGTVLQLSIRRCMRLDERGQREQREIVLVEVVVQVENSRKTGPGGEVFVPTAVAALGFQQVFDAVAHAEAGRIAAGDEPENGPGGLGRRAGRRDKTAFFVALAAFTPSPVGVLRSEEPLAGAQDVGLTIVLAGEWL